MKKFSVIIFITALLALSACSGDTEQEVPGDSASEETVDVVLEEEDYEEAEEDIDEEFYMTIDLSALSERLNNDPAAPADFDRARDGVSYGEIETYEYFSNTTGATRSVLVYTPPSFDPNETYPVLYLLHGIGGTHTEWLGGRPDEVISNLIADGNAVPMIAVMPNVRARYNDSASGDHFSDENVAAFDNFINDLRDDLMPFIEENFPVSQRRSETAIAGLSMGGRAALQIGALMPERFAYIGAFSPAPGLLRTADGGSHAGVLDPEQLTLPDEFRDNTFILLNNGDNEEMFATMTALYFNTLVENGITPVHYVTRGGHDFSVWKNGLYHFAMNIFLRER